MTPADKILQKALVASGIGSDRWETVRADLRDRAFISSRVESLRFLHTAREQTSPMITSAALIVDTNAGLAAGWFAREKAVSYGAKLAFPAQEFIRVAQRLHSRADWTARWTAAGGRLYGGRMAALVTDPVWARVSRFGLPYPPFDYGSGMGVRPVPRREAVRLGVIPEGYATPREIPPQEDFNAKLEADPEWANDSDWQELKAAFGDQVRKVGDKIAWRAHAVRDAFTDGKPFAMRLEQPSPGLLSMLPESAQAVPSAPLTVTQDWLDKKRADGTDHRVHFRPIESHPGDIPLTADDLELISLIWRSPDRALPGVRPDTAVLEMDALSGGAYRLVIAFGANPRIKTFYREGPEE